jgi:hypothetical protein
MGNTVKSKKQKDRILFIGCFGIRLYCAIGLAKEKIAFQNNFKLNQF